MAEPRAAVEARAAMRLGRGRARARVGPSLPADVEPLPDGPITHEQMSACLTKFAQGSGIKACAERARVVRQGCVGNMILLFDLSTSREGSSK
jgi:hypothetical protein